MPSSAPFGLQRHNYTHLSDGQTGTAALVEEAPIAISYQGVSYAVMLATPLDLDDFVFGFSYSNGIINEAQDVLDWNLDSSPQGWLAELTLKARQAQALGEHRHRLMGSSGCGLCGVDSLATALPELAPLTPSPLPTQANLNTLRLRLQQAQVLGPQSGAIHAALLLSPTGETLCLREDIGRHNALDKVLGHALRQRMDLHGHAVVMSSRCSLELVQKAVRAGLSNLVHLASPSTLAVERAQRYGLNLIHLPQRSSARIFAGGLDSLPDNLL